MTYASTGAETVFLTLTRASVADSGFTVTWLSPVSYLMLERPLGLFIDDETGTDFLGDDEIELTITMDGVPLFDGSWDDADTGERWPGLAEAITVRAATKLSATNRVGFTEDVVFTYIEDDVTAAGVQVAFMAPLSAGEPEVTARRVNLAVSDAVSDGQYTFYCSISRLRG